MHLGTVLINAKSTTAVLLDDGTVLDIAAAAVTHTGDVADALKLGSMLHIVDLGDEAVSAIKTLVSEAKSGQHKDALHALTDISLLAPIPVPRKNVFCVGRNYLEHVAEGDKAQNNKVGVSEYPVYFTKTPTAVIGPHAKVPIFPSVSENIDYEVELAAVIGKSGRNISKENAFKHIFGYTIINDITARDVQRRHGGQFFKGKTFDGSCPTGPWIVTADAIGDPQNLDISLTVNGEQRQTGNTRSMIFDIPTIIASLSEGLTLESGDLIATGTPSGVGYAMDPPRYLKHGDTVVCKVEIIGELENTLETTAS